MKTPYVFLAVLIAWPPALGEVDDRGKRRGGHDAADLALPVAVRSLENGDSSLHGRVKKVPLVVLDVEGEGRCRICHCQIGSGGAERAKGEMGIYARAGGSSGRV